MVDCPKATATPCSEGDPSACSDLSYLAFPVRCEPQKHCDPLIPAVNIINTLEINVTGGVTMVVDGFDPRFSFEVIITAIKNGAGAQAVINDWSATDKDVAKGSQTTVVRGNTLDNSIGYLVAIRRYRGDEASVWTGGIVGLGNRTRAFSNGFSFGFS